MTKEVEPVEDDGVELEDMKISFEDQPDEDELEEASEDESTEEPETETEKAESEESEAEEETEEASEEETTEEEAKESQPSDEDKQKQHNKEMAEKRIQEKKAREAEIRKQQNEYVAEAEDDTQLALRQLQVDAYNNKVDTNANKLKNDFGKAMNDFPILTDLSPEIQAELNSAIDTFQALNVKIDEWGNPSEVRGDLYEFLQNKAESIERLSKLGAKKESTAKGKTRANTLTPPSRTPKEPKKDEMLDAFDEEANRW